MIEHRVVGFVGQLADEHRQGFLAADLAAVDGADRQNDELPGSLRLLGRRDGRIADDHDGD